MVPQWGYFTNTGAASNMASVANQSEQRLRTKDRRQKFEKSWQQRFAEFAAQNDSDAGIAGWSETGLQTRFRFFTSLWQRPNPSALYVDAGCGAGTYSRWLANEGLSVIGVDYSLTSLIKAKQREPERVAYCAADASRLPFPDASVDGLLCFGVLQAVWEAEPFVFEAARVLKSGGELWIDALNASGLHAKWDKTMRRLRGKAMHLRYESPRALVSMIEGAGFSKVTRHWLPIMPHRLQRLQVVCESRTIQGILNTITPLGAIASHSVLVRGVLEKK